MIHDYLDYNPPAARVKAERLAAAERMRNLRDGRREGDEQTPNRGGTAAECSPEPEANNERSSGSPSPSPSPDPVPGPGPVLSLSPGAAETGERELSTDGPGQDAQEVVGALREYFRRRTGLDPPAEGSELERDWNRPLRALATLVDGEIPVGEKLIRQATEKLWKDGCVAPCPRSILKVARAMAGKVKVQADRGRYIKGRYGDRVKH